MKILNNETKIIFKTSKAKIKVFKMLTAPLSSRGGGTINIPLLTDFFVVPLSKSTVDR